MTKFFLTAAILLELFNFCQAQKKMSIFIQGHVNNTFYDRTISNNAVGFGGSLQLFLNTNSGIHPTIEASSDIFGGTKELYVTANDAPIFAKETVGSILGGADLTISKNAFFGILTGLSFFNSQSFFTLKPSAEIRFPANHRFTFKIAFVHIFQHDYISNQPFGYLSTGLGIRII
jgi:hypothetical protein